MDKPLQGFGSACLAMRAEAEAAGQRYPAMLAKALAVAVVGKLHAHDEEWEECTPDYNDPVAGSWLGPDGRGGLTEWTALAGQVARRLRRGLSWCAVPEIALWIWSAGRNWLWERMACAGLDDVYYADTDSLVVTKRGYERLGAAGYIRDSEWGELRLVAGPIEVEVLGPKMCRLGDEIIQAGAPKDQRGRDFADKGYWYRAPLDGGAEAYMDGVFPEAWRERKTGT